MFHGQEKPVCAVPDKSMDVFYQEGLATVSNTNTEEHVGTDILLRVGKAVRDEVAHRNVEDAISCQRPSDRVSRGINLTFGESDHFSPLTKLFDKVLDLFLFLQEFFLRYCYDFLASN